jgi:hypothetical protein
LSEGRHGYLVRRTFVPDDKLEEKFINDKKKEVNSVFVYSYCLFIYLFADILICLLNRKYMKMTWVISWYKSTTILIHLIRRRIAREMWFLKILNKYDTFLLVLL